MNQTQMLKLLSTLAVAATVSFGALPAKAAYLERTVAAFSSKSFNYDADRGETFRVAISGDGDTDLDLVVKNQYGETVCAKRGVGDDEVCRIYSRYGGHYEIQILNLGSVYNEFSLLLE